MGPNRMCVTILILVTVVGAANAQQGTSAIQGRTVDPQGGALPGANVVVTHRDTGIIRETVSGADGTYSVTNLVPGPYSVTAKMQGFKQLTLERIVLTAGSTQSQDLTLEIGALEESITVSGQAPQVDVTSAAVGGHVSLKEVEAIPSISHTVVGFLQVVPSVVYITSSLKNSTDQAFINGQRDGTAFYLDGGSNYGDYAVTATRVTVPTDVIQEVQVISVQVPAEYGRRKGAVVNVTTKQGTNSFSGSGYAFYGPPGLVAPTFLEELNNREPQDINRNQFGFTIGGPIVRNKLFFFGSLERTLVGQSNVVTYPSRPDKNYATQTRIEAWTPFIRIDHQINPSNMYSIRYLARAGTCTDSPGCRAGGDPFIPTRGSTLDTLTNEWQDDKLFVASYTRIFSDSKLNVFTFSTPKQTIRTGVPDEKSEVDSDCVSCRLPTLRHVSLDDGVSYFNHTREEPNFRFDNAFSWFAGAHNLKFGALYSYSFHNRVNRDAQNGIFNFPSDRPFNTADPSTYPEFLSIRTGPQGFRSRMHSWGFYGQDKWQWTNDLTLTLGLRYDVHFAPTPNEFNPLFTDRESYPVDRGLVQPRIGFAYAMNEGKSALRGGYGVYFQAPLFGTDIDNFYQRGVYGTGLVLNFPASGVRDPGPSAGRLPTDPFLVNGPVVDHALLRELFPPDALILNNRNVIWLDNPDRKQTKAQQFSLGYELGLGNGVSFRADYVRTRESGVINRGSEAYDLNPGLRASTSRTAPIVRTDLHRIADQLGLPPFQTSVFTFRNDGRERYDGLNLGIDKRSANWGARASYTLARCEATTAVQVLEVQSQEWGPCLGRDRTHILSLSGNLAAPWAKGVVLSGSFRSWTGTPFTITNSNTDPNRNGLFEDPAPAGTYSGAGPGAFTVTNKGGFGGARGPVFAQLDARLGYRFRVGGERTLETSLDIFNVTNEPNIANPIGDQRNANFLRPTGLVGAISRQLQVSARLRF